jgi:hypothetical protein
MVDAIAEEEEEEEVVVVRWLAEASQEGRRESRAGGFGQCRVDD